MTPVEFEQITKQYVGFTEMLKFCETESDRGAAILASSYLEAFLTDCLKLFLVDDPFVEKNLFKSGVLSNFHGNINMAFALGLISKETRINLHAIREVRNHFAHSSLATASFNDAEVKEESNALSMTTEVEENKFRNSVKGKSDSKERFLFVLGMCGMQLYSTILRQTRRTLIETDIKSS